MYLLAIPPQAKAMKKEAMEERVGQAVSKGKVEAEKLNKEGANKVLLIPIILEIYEYVHCSIRLVWCYSII